MSSSDINLIVLLTKPVVTGLNIVNIDNLPQFIKTLLHSLLMHSNELLTEIEVRSIGTIHNAQ